MGRPVMGFFHWRHYGPLNTVSKRPQVASLLKEPFPTFVFWGPSVQSPGVFLAIRLSLQVKKKKKKGNIRAGTGVGGG